jgi:catechol 2,3-dioxygenase-like lactoylglutathione lyase family enzyme
VIDETARQYYLFAMSIPFTLRKLDHVVLRVRDLEKSLAFYRDVIGCPVDKVQDTIGLWQVRAGESLIDLVPLDGLLGKIGGTGPAKEGRNLDHFAIQVVPFDEGAIRAHLAAHNVAIADSGRRYGAEGEGPSIYIQDPDGNTVGLKGPATPASA